MVTDAEETDGVTFDIYNRVAQESLNKNDILISPDAYWQQSFQAEQTNHRRPVEGVVNIGQNADSGNRRESTKSVSFQERYETPYKMMTRDELDDDELRRKVRWKYDFVLLNDYFTTNVN